jgi:uncharacterized membrane protein
MIGRMARGWAVRRSAADHRPGEGGSITLLVIGFAAVLLLLVAVVVSASTLFLARRELVAWSDGAALAAVQRVSEQALYTGGRVEPDPAAAAEAAAAYLGSVDPDRLRRVGLADVLVDGAGVVTIVVVGEVRLPFEAPGVPRLVPMSASASARLSLAAP